MNFDDSFSPKIDRSIQCSDEIKEEIRGHFTTFLRLIELSGCKDDFQIGIEARYEKNVIINLRAFCIHSISY